jgi:hypothetical protein
VEAPHGHSEAALIAWLQECHQDARARLEVSRELSIAGLKSLQLINGGAIIALFALLGTDSEFAKRISDAEIYIAFAGFAVGLIAGLAAFICSYLAQESFSGYEQDVANNSFEALGGLPFSAADEGQLKVGAYFGKAALLSAVAGLICFLIGAGSCLLAAIS